MRKKIRNKQRAGHVTCPYCVIIHTSQRIFRTRIFTFYAQIEKFSPVTEMPEYKKVLEEMSMTQNLDIPALSCIFTDI